MLQPRFLWSASIWSQGTFILSNFRLICCIFSFRYSCQQGRFPTSPNKVFLPRLARFLPSPSKNHKDI